MQILEAEVKSLTHFMSELVNQILSPKSIDPTSLTSSFRRLDPEIELMIEEEVKCKIERLENQIKQMKETHTASVSFSDIYLYPNLEYPPKFPMSDYKNMMGMVVTHTPSFARNNNVLIC